MDFRNRHKVVEGCNWLMVGVAVGWIAYVFAGLFSSPSDSQTIWLPPPVVQRVLPAEAAPAPIWGPGDIAAMGSNRDTDSGQGRATAFSSDGSSLTASAPAPDPTANWGDGPYAVAPEFTVPPITPVHPVLGPDF